MGGGGSKKKEEEPPKTAEKTTENTEKTAEKTEKTAENTEKPAETTEKPAETTEKPAESAEKPTEESAPSDAEVEKRMQELREKLKIAEETLEKEKLKSAENEKKAAENEKKAAEIAEKAAENEKKAAENAEKTAETTEKTAETTENSGDLALLAAAEKEIDHMEATIAEKTAENEKISGELKIATAEIEKLKSASPEPQKSDVSAEIAEKAAKIAALETEIGKKSAEIAEKDKKLADMAEKLAEKDKKLAEMAENEAKMAKNAEKVAEMAAKTPKIADKKPEKTVEMAQKDGTLQVIPPADGTAAAPLVLPGPSVLNLVSRFLMGDPTVGDADVSSALAGVPPALVLDWFLMAGLHVRRLTDLVTLTSMSTGVYGATGDLMLSITTEACELLNATRATVFAADRQNRQLFSLIASKQNEIKAETRAKTDSGLNRKYKPRRIVNKREFLTIRIPEDEGIVGQVYTSGEPLVIADAHESSFFNPENDRKTGFRTRSVCCVPLIINGQRLGSLQVINPKNGGVFTEDDLMRLESLATRAAVQLRLDSVISEAKSVASKNPLIDALGNRSLELEVSVINTINKTVEDVKRVLDCEKASVFILDEDKNDTPELFTVTDEGVEIRFPASAGLAGECFTKREPINIPEPYKDPRFNQAFDKKTGYKTRSILCMPLFSQDLDPKGGRKIVGVVQALSKGDDDEEFFEDEDELYFQRQVAHAGGNIAFARLYEGANVLG